MKFVRPHRERQMLLDMTPMIDVVFQLLIFFLTTAQLASLSRADIELPREPGEKNKIAEEAGLIINVTSAGQLVVAGRDVTVNDIEAMVHERLRTQDDLTAQQFRLMIRADRNCDAAHLNALVQRLHSLGVGAARIATSPPR